MKKIMKIISFVIGGIIFVMLLVGYYGEIIIQIIRLGD